MTVTPTGDTAKVTVLGAATLNIAADRGSTPASPSSVPTSDVPLQRTSPHVQSAPILQLPLLNSPILQLPLLNSPILQLPLLNSPIIQLPLLNSPILQLPLLNSPLGFDSIGDANDLGSSPAVQAGLSRISLAALPIIAGPGLADAPRGHRARRQAAADDHVRRRAGPASRGRQAARRCPSSTLSASPLGTLTSLSLFMGDTRLKAIGGAGFGWCAKLEGLGHADCGADLGVQGSADKGQSASLLSLEISGVNLDAIDGLKAVLLRDVTFPAVGAGRAAGHPTRPRSTWPRPASAASCSRPFPTRAGRRLRPHRLLGQLHQDGLRRVRGPVPCSRRATIGALGTAAGGLTLQEAVLGTYASDAANAYDVAANQLGVLGYGGAGTSQVAYHVEFTGQSALNAPDASWSPCPPSSATCAGRVS